MLLHDPKKVILLNLTKNCGFFKNILEYFIFILAMWKFVNNVLFGKSMEDGTKNIDVRLMSDKRKIDEVG